MSIEYRAFYECSSLARITLSDGIVSIGTLAFSGCTSLTEVIIPESVVDILDRAFMKCTNLAKITIPDGVTYIGEGAFLDCVSLTSITIPASVAYIGRCLGYYYGEFFLEKIPGFTIYGYTGTEAERYAIENGFNFIALDSTSTVLLGDLTGDGVIDATDASEALSLYANIQCGNEANLTDAEFEAADVNKDGCIDATDALLISTYYTYVQTGKQEIAETLFMK